MDGSAVLVVHLIELVDQAHALVGQHKRASLQRPLAGHWVGTHSGGQTNGARTLTCARVYDV